MHTNASANTVNTQLMYTHNSQTFTLKKKQTTLLTKTNANKSDFREGDGSNSGKNFCSPSSCFVLTFLIMAPSSVVLDLMLCPTPVFSMCI